MKSYAFGFISFSCRDCLHPGIHPAIFEEERTVAGISRRNALKLDNVLLAVDAACYLRHVSI